MDISCITDTEVDHHQSDAEILQNLCHLSDELSTQQISTSSLHVPYKEIRQYIRTNVSSPNPLVVLKSCQLYMQLLSKVAVAYEELTLSMCMHNISKSLKEPLVGKCKNSCKKATTLCSANGHVDIRDYSLFWKHLFRLVEENALDISNDAVFSIVIQAFSDLIRYSRGSVLLETAAIGVNTILNEETLTMSNAIDFYKKLAFPLIRVVLPNQNHKLFMQAIIQTADCEQNLISMSPANVEDNTHDMTDNDVPREGIENPSPLRKNNPSLVPPQKYPVLTFLELCCCVSVPERAEIRASLGKSIHTLLRSRNEEHMQHFISFLQTISCHSKGNIRLLATELCFLFLQDSEHTTGGRDTILSLFHILSDRSSDRIATVRAKSIHSVTNALKSFSGDMLKSISSDIQKYALKLTGRIRDAKSRVRKCAVDYIGFALEQYLLQTNANDSAVEDVVSRLHWKGQSEDGNISLLQYVNHLKHRCSDTVANVRCSAILHISRAILISSGLGCRDDLDRLLDCWADAVLPKISDVDSHCQELCLSAVGTLLFGPDHWLAKGGNLPPSFSQNRVLLSDLFLLKLGSGQPRVVEFGKKAITSLNKKGNISRDELRHICLRAKCPEKDDLLDKGVSEGAWIALEAMAMGGDVRNVQRELGQGVLLNAIRGKPNPIACRIASKLVDSMNSSTRDSVEASLLDFLFANGDSFRKRYIAGSIDAVIQLLASIRPDIGDDLLQRCENVVVENRDDMSEAMTMNSLDFIGSICVSFKLQKEPSESVLTFVEAMTNSTQPSSNLRALAISTLGKICLYEGLKSPHGVTEPNSRAKDKAGQQFSNRMGETLTRRLVPVFVHELQHATSSATRNNAVIVLCDLCRQYTSVVEPLLSRLTILLQDASEFVRIQVISSLISLLQEDYIKIRTGPMFYEIGRCLVDRSETIRATAEYALLHVVSPKNQSILAISFIELIFVLNNCTECNLYNQFPTGWQQQKSENLRFTFEKRQNIYEVFLRGMSIEHKLRLPGRLRCNILGLILEEKLSLSCDSVQNVLEDTLILISSAELSPFTNNKGRDEEGMDESEMNDTEQMKATTGDGAPVSKKITLLRKIQLVELRETTIPALLEMRHILERMRSPLLKVLMESVCRLLHPYRNELESMIADSVARSEIMHEMSKTSSGSKENQTQRDKKVRRVRYGRAEPLANKTFSSDYNSTAQESTSRTPCKTTDTAHGEEKLSVPRTRRREKHAENWAQTGTSDEDEIELEEGNNGGISRRMSFSIEASPKLASIARKSSPGVPAREKCKKMSSGFAETMASIEREVKM